MSTNQNLRVRESVRTLQEKYDNGDKAPLENLMRAWKGIKELPPENEHSFFKLGGFHGEPFVGAGWGNSAYWGGWCNHGNVLFPTWHRVYVLKLEEALQSIPGCEDVMMPYWDQTSQESLDMGIPKALTDEFFTLDGVQIKNPLRSYVFPVNVHDNIQSFYLLRILNDYLRDCKTCETHFETLVIRTHILITCLSERFDNLMQKKIIK